MTYIKPAKPKVDERIKAIVIEHLGIDEAEVTPSASFIEDLGADSLDVVELVMTIEQEFDLEIPDEEIDKLATVKDLIAYVEKKVQ